MKLTLPELCLVVLIGPSGSGKSSFARRLFLPTEVVSSDACRGMVSDDENSQAATGDAFEVLRFIAGKRLARGRLTVIDATNVQAEARKSLVELAFEHDVLPVAVVLDLPEEVCAERNKSRPDRAFGAHVIRNQSSQLRRSLRHLEREGFRYVHVLRSPAEADAVEIERQRLWNNRRQERGPFDIIGDVHGCYDELIELLNKLGYDTAEPDRVVPPVGRKAVFLGDLVDRGPKSVEVLRLVQSMIAQGNALCVPGNHDSKLLRKLRGRNVQVSHGLAETLAQLDAHPEVDRKGLADFLDSLIGHYVLDGGRLVVAHAGMKQKYIGRASKRVREFALYGETTGETDEFGVPVRYNWAADYRGEAHIVYGHTPVPEADWLNRTICIDTGCVFGGKLTALRWPEKDLVSAAARQTYAKPSRPLRAGDVPEFGEQQPGLTYPPRPGAYAVVTDDRDRVAVAKYRGDFYLPGGGIDAGESAEQAVVRESLEECGLRVTCGAEIGQAIQNLINDRGLGCAKQCAFFRCRLELSDATSPTEPGYELAWLSVEQAIAQLKLPAEVWAVRRAMEAGLSPQQQNDDVLDLADVSGKRIVSTRLHHTVTIREENATAALEVMSRFAASPKWLIYLPPTMSPTETTDQPGLLEHPASVFAYFRAQGVQQVMCEEKHMGSRAVAIVCRDEAAALRRFGVSGDGSGIIYTRTGRRFFEDRRVEQELLDVLRGAINSANGWEEFGSDWFCLDCELMPWSAKAQDLLRTQYAAVGSASVAAMDEACAVLEQAAQRYGGDGEGLLATLDRQRERRERVHRYVDAYRRYCWPVKSVADLKLAPFHVLASEGKVHVDRDHRWHMDTIGRLAGSGDSPLMVTRHRLVDLNDESQVQAGIDWWQTLTEAGGEGMVVKPLDFAVRGPKGLVQPAVKCRGREYLRIIYGPEYDLPENLTRLRHRGLAAKRSLALREFALGVEGLERFVRREPLRRVHECVFGVLALESEPVDPRL